MTPTRSFWPAALLGLCLAASMSACNADSAPSEGTSTDDTYRTQAIKILESVPLIDGHNDVPIAYRGRAGYKFSILDFMNTRNQSRPMHTDIERLRAGHVGGQFWSVYVSAGLDEAQAVQQTMEQVDFVYRLIAKYPDHFELALTADDIERVFKKGKIASMLGMEGGHSIGNSLGVLRQFYALGVRYMTLTHSRTLDWADAAGTAERHGGLTEFGKEVVREMNRLGMMVDLSHVSPGTMSDALDVTEAPVIFSHSSARGVADHPRNVPDSILIRTKANGGLVMVTFVPSYITPETKAYSEASDAERARLNGIFPNNADTVRALMRAWNQANPAPQASLKQVADHIDHIKNTIGVDYAGVGGDYDGIGVLPVGLEDVSNYPDLFAELLRRGYSEEDLRKIAGLNLLRVMRGVESVAARLQKEREPSEALFRDYAEQE